jgi:uncharacterized membrane protein
MNHPLHPILVHLPVGLWTASFIFDIAYLFGANASLAAAAYYCMLVGLIAACLAIPTGLAEYIEIPQRTTAKRLAVGHLLLNLVVTALYVINLFARHAMFGAVPIAVSRGQLILSFFSLLILGVSGYLGGLLVYEHGVGFRPELRDRDRHRINDEIRRSA